MSTLISRLYNFVTDKANGVKITASEVDAELNQDVVAMNRKVLCSGSAPSSPIAGQTWVDTTNKFLKWYRNNEWVIISVVHVGTSQPATVQEGDLWYDTTNNILKSYDGSAFSNAGGLPPNYRSAMYVMQASTTTITVAPGTVEVNGASIAKTSNTTLTVSTAGDWAGGSSLRAVSTVAFVGIDISGNIKMHTTAPTHADYALSITAANNTKRYASWSGTTYRIIGWFYMNATGSGELDTYGVSNIADGSVKNVVEFQTGTVSSGLTGNIPVDNTTPLNAEGDVVMSIPFRATNVNMKLVINSLVYLYVGGNARVAAALSQDTGNAIAAAPPPYINNAGNNNNYSLQICHHMKAGVTTVTLFKIKTGAEGTSYSFNGGSGGAIFNGLLTSFIRVEEVEAQLT